MPVHVLVVDIGGSQVKCLASNQPSRIRFDSGPDYTPSQLVNDVFTKLPSWEYDVVSIGYPGPTTIHGPSGEAGNLGHGWIGFDFAAAFQRPVRIINDAAMQALGGYDGGRMLFLGLGTGLGSSLVTENVVVPLELGCLHSHGETLATRLGNQGLLKSGTVEWNRAVSDVVVMLMAAFSADYIVLGGGNAAIVDPLPRNVRRGGNDDAFVGGFRLWEEIIEPHDRPSSQVWRLVR